MSEKGRFFMIDRRIWAKLCDLGMNQAAAYLVLACGTGADNRSTSWSTSAISKYAGIGVVRSKQAIESLIRDGFIRRGEGSTRDRPRYELIPMGPRRADSTDDSIWLPNAIVMGTENGEVPPVQRLRSSGDPWALRLFVDLYHAQNLRDEGGISPQVLREGYVRKRISEHGIYVIWGFKSAGTQCWWSGPLSPHQKRPMVKGQKEHPVWDSICLLRDTGLLTFVPHICESDALDAEILHPYGIGGSDELPIEQDIGAAAQEAANKMAQWNVERAESEGFEHFCPILQTLPNVQMIGVARLRYRPHTGRTSAWYAQLQEQGRFCVRKYQERAAGAEGNRALSFG